MDDLRTAAQALLDALDNVAEQLATPPASDYVRGASDVVGDLSEHAADVRAALSAEATEPPLDDGWVEVAPDWLARACDRAHASPHAAEVGHRDGFCLACAELRAAWGSGSAPNPQGAAWITPDEVDDEGNVTFTGEQAGERAAAWLMTPAAPDEPGDDDLPPTTNRAFQHVGERSYVEGVPFGSWVEPGDCYVSDRALWEGDVDLLAEVERLRGSEAALRRAFDVAQQAGVDLWAEVERLRRDRDYLVGQVSTADQADEIDRLTDEVERLRAAANRQTSALVAKVKRLEDRCAVLTGNLPGHDVRAGWAEATRQRDALAAEAHEAEQVLAAALPDEFPTLPDSDDRCTGEHVLPTLAAHVVNALRAAAPASEDDEALTLSDEDAELHAATLAEFSAPRAAGSPPPTPAPTDDRGLTYPLIRDIRQQVAEAIAGNIGRDCDDVDAAADAVMALLSTQPAPPLWTGDYGMLSFKGGPTPAVLPPGTAVEVRPASPSAVTPPTDPRPALYDALTRIVGDIGPIDGESSRWTAAVMLRHYGAEIRRTGTALRGWVSDSEDFGSEHGDYTALTIHVPGIGHHHLTDHHVALVDEGDAMDHPDWGRSDAADTVPDEDTP